MITNPVLASALAIHGKEMRVPVGAIIYEPGEETDGVYVLRSGKVDLQLLDENDKAVWSRTMSDYSILGLHSALGHHPHCVRAVARESSHVVFVSKGELADAILKDTSLGAEVLLALGNELRDLQKKARMFNTRVRGQSRNHT
jgi:CRP/FNR family transcriptional regulator